MYPILTYFFRNILIIFIEFENVDEFIWFIVAIAVLGFLTLFIFSLFTIIQKNHRRIQMDKNYEKEVSSFLEELDVNKNTLARFYVPMTLARKFIFAILVLIYNYEHRYFTFVLFDTHCIFLTVVIWLRPFKSFSNNSILIFNELMIFVISVFSGVFMEKDTNNDTALIYGWIWISLVTFTVFANWSLVLFMILRKIVKKKCFQKIDLMEEKAAKIKACDAKNLELR